jgi:hypothetical protein
MTLILYYWSRVWQSVALDPLSGRGHVRWLSRRPSRCAGWAFKHDGVWYALWNDGKNLIFQAGQLRVPVTGASRASNVRLGDSRKFTIENGGQVAFELSYKARDRDWDPTFDLMDLEQADFFFTCHDCGTTKPGSAMRSPIGLRRPPRAAMCIASLEARAKTRSRPSALCPTPGCESRACPRRCTRSRG